MDVVIKVPYELKVDPQGRVVMPKELRRILGVVEGGSIVLEKKNNRVFIQASRDIERDVEQWKEKLKGMSIEAKGFEAGESKWVSEDWAKKKLGTLA